MKVRSRSLPCLRAKAAASSTVSPCRMTSAPCRRVLTTFTVGVLTGMTMVDGYRQAARVIGDALRVVAGRHGDHAALALVRPTGQTAGSSAPRSLNDAVNCRFSNLSQTLQPRMSDSVRLKSQSVSTMAPRSRSRAASTSSSVTGNVRRTVSCRTLACRHGSFPCNRRQSRRLSAALPQRIHPYLASARRNCRARMPIPRANANHRLTALS